MLLEVDLYVAMCAGEEKYGARRIRKTVYLVAVLFCSACGIPSNCCFDTVQLGWMLQSYINIYVQFYSNNLPCK